MDPQIVVAVIGGIAAVVTTALGATHLWKRRERHPQRRPGSSSPAIPDWVDAFGTAERVLVQIEASGWRPNLVLGLGRSGALWGGWFAGNLGSLPIAVADILYRETLQGRAVTFPLAAEILGVLRGHAGNAPKVLVVEGATATGQTMTEFIEQHKEQLAGWDIKLGVLYKNRAVARRVDFVGKILDPWPRKLPWHLRAAYRTHMNGMAEV